MKIKNYIDTPYYVIFGTYFAICFVLSLVLIIFHSNFGFMVVGIFFAVLISLMTYLFYFRSYSFNNKSMVVKVGFITKEYLYQDMQKCFITQNNCLSYATSFKRICIELKDNSKIYISPEKMDEILFELVKKTEVLEKAKEKVVKPKKLDTDKTKNKEDDKPAKKKELPKTETRKAATKSEGTKKTRTKKPAAKASETKKSSAKKTTPAKTKPTAKKSVSKKTGDQNK